MIGKVFDESTHLKIETLANFLNFLVMMCGVVGSMFLTKIIDFNSMIYLLDIFANESKSIIFQDLPLTFYE